MIDKRIETRLFLGTIVFLVVYCLFLLLFRSVLQGLETKFGSVLKPEPGQIGVVALVILLWYFAFLGLSVFSGLGKWQRITANVIAVVLTGSLLYGLRQWYTAVVNNPFLFSNRAGELPWYAKEDIKFLLANTPLMLFFISVFAVRMLVTGINKGDSPSSTV